MRRARTRSALIAALILLTLAGCGTGGSPAPTVTETVTVTAGATPDSLSSETPSESPTEDSSSAAPDTVKFGQTFVYDNGLAVTVGAPVSFKPSVSAACDKGKATEAFLITIKNGTGEHYDPTSFHASVQSGETEGGTCYDSAKGINGSPDTKVLAGRSVKFTLVFVVANPRDIVMQVRPGFDYGDSLFTS